MNISKGDSKGEKKILIYPYWNVDMTGEEVTLCKDCILIYPYWNVDCGKRTILSGTPVILIYPYWNVDIKLTKTMRHLQVF